MITVIPRTVNGTGFSWRPVPRSITLFNEAVTYLRQSNAAAALLDFLRNEDEISLLCTEDTVSTFYPAQAVTRAGCNVRGSLVTWNPYESKEINDIRRNRPVGRFRANPNRAMVAGMQSPAMGLIHELGHARQYFLKNTWFMQNYNAAGGGNATARLLIENDNLLTVESVVARQLHEGIRWKYGDMGRGHRNANIAYQLNNPIDPVLV